MPVANFIGIWPKMSAFAADKKGMTDKIAIQAFAVTD